MFPTAACHRAFLINPKYPQQKGGAFRNRKAPPFFMLIQLPGTAIP